MLFSSNTLESCGTALEFYFQTVSTMFDNTTQKGGHTEMEGGGNQIFASHTLALGKLTRVVGVYYKHD